MFAQELDEFFRRVKKSLSPRHYHELSRKPLKSSFQYLFGLMVLSLVVMSIISLPRFFFLPSYLNEQIGKITTFTVNASLTTTSPVYFPNMNTFLTVDTSGAVTELKEGNLFISREKVQYKLFNNVFTDTTESFKDMLQRKDFLKYTFLLLTLFILPSVFIALFLIYFIKYFALLLLFSLPLFILFKVMRHKGSLKQFINAAMYAATPFIMIEVIASPLGLLQYLFPFKVLYIFNIYLITTTLFLLYYVLVTFTMMHERQQHAS